METLFLRSKVLVDVRAAGMGYTGMHLIHPSHVPVVNEVFTPTSQEVAQWRGLIDAMEQQRSQGGAAVTYAGDMVDIAHEETAREMVAMARKMGVPGA